MELKFVSPALTVDAWIKKDTMRVPMFANRGTGSLLTSGGNPNHHPSACVTVLFLRDCHLTPPYGQSQGDEPPAKMTKLAIVEEREEDKYDHVTSIKCWTCDPENGTVVPEALSDPKVSSIFIGIVFKLTKRVDAITHQWSDASDVLSASVRGQSLGRRDQPLRAYADDRAICLSSHTRFW